MLIWLTRLGVCYGVMVSWRINWYGPLPLRSFFSEYCSSPYQPYCLNGRGSFRLAKTKEFFWACKIHDETLVSFILSLSYGKSSLVFVSSCIK